MKAMKNGRSVLHGLIALLISAAVVAVDVGAVVPNVVGRVASAQAQVGTEVDGNVFSDQPMSRVKDVARLQGVRANQLVGMGLVVGLEGTGDGRGTQAN